MILFSDRNLVETATAVGSTQDPVYLASNARNPERPFFP